MGTLILILKYLKIVEKGRPILYVEEDALKLINLQIKCISYPQ